MRTVSNKVLGISAIAISLSFAGVASAIPIMTTFNFVPTGVLNTNNGTPGNLVAPATTVTSGAPDLVTTIITDNTGLVSLVSIINLTDPTPVTKGATFTKFWDTPLGTFTESLTVTSVSVGVSSLGITAKGTISSTNGMFDPSTPVFYSASYTQNGGPGAQINASFNNSTTPPKVPEPATLLLLGSGLLGMVATRYLRKNRG